MTAKIPTHPQVGDLRVLAAAARTQQHALTQSMTNHTKWPTRLTRRKPTCGTLRGSNTIDRWRFLLPRLDVYAGNDDSNTALIIRQCNRGTAGKVV